MPDSWILRLRRALAGRIAPTPRVLPVSVPTDPDDPESWQAIDHIHDQLTEQLKNQNAVWAEMDGRLRLILGITGIVFAAVLGFQRAATYLLFPVGALTILSVGLFMVAALIAALAFRTRDFNWPPNPQGLYQGYLHRDPRMAKQSTCLAIIFAYNRNGSIIQEKNRSFNIAFTFASVAVFVLGIALMAHIALQTMPPGVPLPAPTTTAAPATNPTGGTGGSGTTP